MAMLGLEVGGWVASTFIGELADKARSYASNQCDYLTADTKEKLKRLESNLKKIHAAVYVASRSKIENPELKQWLLDLKDAAYDAEDILDTFEYRVLEDKADANAQVSSSYLASISREFSKSARTVFRRFLLRDDDLNELLEIVERFHKIVDEMGHFLTLVNLDQLASLEQKERVELPVTTSKLMESRVFGRASESTDVMKFLLEMRGGGSRFNNTVPVLPIVGIGGVGKTTLVQSVYQDQNVKDHFDVRAWVCVSLTFDIKRLMREIGESASISWHQVFHQLQNLNHIQEILMSGLAEKRFLIVLDDLWNVDPREWEMLQSTLNSGKEGSRIIITTRDQNIAKMVGTMNALTLISIEDEEFWRFFVQCAFGDANPKDHPNLEFIAKQIVSKLGGLPLAAKMMGGVLRSDFRERHWKGVLESKLWTVDEGGIMPVLRLSYEHLPAHLKQCFVFCSLFPQDYIFSMLDLVRMWIAQGFIQPNEENNLEDIGIDYFHELERKSFFDKGSSFDYPYRPWSNNRIRSLSSQIFDEYYVMHDLIHDLAQYLSHDEYCYDHMLDNEPVNIQKRVRHLCIHAANLTAICKTTYLMNTLRTLVVHGPFNSDVSLDIIGELKGLRVLFVVDVGAESFPRSVRKLIHLRYLKFTGDHLVMKMPLAEEICKLYHLQVLHLGSNRVLPKGCASLINIHAIPFLHSSSIAGIGKLTLLGELTFKIMNENGHEISQLREMRQLKWLTIDNLENLVSREEASKARLENKKRLHTLNLQWGDESTHAQEVLDGLRPHPNLRDLPISFYPGIKSPSWFDVNSLPNLETVYLAFCPMWEILPCLGQLPFLKNLRLSSMGAVKQIFSGVDGIHNGRAAFPSLERLQLIQLAELEEWSGGHILFPRLSFLRIQDCPKLKRPIFLPSQLNKLEVNENSLLAWRVDTESVILKLSCLTEWIPVPRLSSIKVMEFEGTYFSSFTAFTADQEEWFQNLTSLVSLSFTKFRNLQSLPSTLRILPSLHNLRIEDCNNIRLLPDDGLPSSLITLDIRDCHPMLHERCRENGLDWHKIAHVQNININ